MMKLKYVCVLGVLVVLLGWSSWVRAGAIFVPTGGSVASSSFGGDFGDTQSVDLNGEYGDFQASSRVRVPVIDPNDFQNPRETVAESSASANLQPTRFDLAADTDGFRDFLFPDGDEGVFGGSATTRVSFTLNKPAPVRFEWFGDAFLGDWTASATLRDAEDKAHLFCVGGPNAVIIDAPGGGCLDGHIEEDFPLLELGQMGSIDLEAGDYEVVLSANVINSAGTSGGGGGMLALVVPTPATGSVFAWGLMALGWLGSRPLLKRGHMSC